MTVSDEEKGKTRQNLYAAELYTVEKESGNTNSESEWGSPIIIQYKREASPRWVTPPSNKHIYRQNCDCILRFYSVLWPNIFFCCIQNNVIYKVMA